MPTLFALARTLIIGGGALMRNAAMVSAACFTLVTVSAAEEAEAAARKPVSVPPQGLGPALQHVAKEYGFQIVFVSEDVQGLRTNGAVGELTLDEALTEVLAGTGLTFQYLDDRTVTVTSVSAEAQSSKSVGSPWRANGADSTDNLVFDIDIPATNAAKALDLLAEQTESEMRYSHNLVRVRQVNAVRGRFTLQEGLELLLRDTGLSSGFSNKRVVIIADNGNMPAGKGESVRKHRLLTGLIAAVLGSPATNARADQELADGTSAKLEEVIVTAQKREERLLDVPISISVLNGEDLDALTVEGVTEALNRVPGVAAIASFQGAGTNVAIRGVTAGGPEFAGSSPVAYYLDSVPFGFVKTAQAPDANAYDMERVEVLRGPQGTLYGASAQNGVVRVLTKDANLDEYEFKARVSTSNTQGGDWNYRGDMAVNVPIIDGKLAARAVLGYQDLSGWIDHPNTNDKDANDAELGSLRLKIAAQPTDRLSVAGSAWLSRSDYGAPSIGTDNEQRNAFVEEPISNDYDAYGLKVSYDFPVADLTSMTSYFDYDSGSILDLIDLVGFSVPLFTGFESEVIAQEVILNSTHDGPWRWTVGGIFRDAEDRIFATIGDLLPVPTDFSNRSKSYAVFGEVTRLFLDGEVELTGGLRYFEDDVTVTENQTALPPLTEASATFDETSPRVVLTWHPNSNFTLYSSYAEGFRSGFPQDPPVVKAVPGFPPLAPDTLKNYEVGAKGSLFADRITFDAALYYIDWEGVQQSLTVDIFGQLFTATVNGESASGVGLDFGVTARPTDMLELGVNFGWNDLTMDSDVFSGGGLLFAKGDRLNLSPELTVGASADYVFPLGGSGLGGRFSLSANYISEQSRRTIVGTTQSIAAGDSILTARASLSIKASDYWAVTVFADNIANEGGSMYGSPFAGRPIPDWDIRVRPRTVGAQFEYRF